MRPLLFSLIITLIGNAALAQTTENYSRAKIYLDASTHTMRALSALGLSVENGQYKKDAFFISDFSQYEMDKAKHAGFRVEIVIPDVVKYYREQNSKPSDGARTTAATCTFPSIPTPAHFHLGSYAGFFTYTEMLQILDSMRLLYPGLISARQSIDTFHSVLDSPIYWIRISNHPDSNQPAKPQMLYTALHHAREPGCLSATIYYLWYLLENYSTDAHIKALVDNTELYFIPCVNPDGYLYNIYTNPAGGGLWRKNRRHNSDGTNGVDLNRNYSYHWGYDNFGSSPRDTDDTYRGPAPSSEPETRAVEWMAKTHHFKLALNAHTYNNDLLYPWSYMPSHETVDSNIFFGIAQLLTTPAHYRYGTCNQTLNYTANGDSNDWMYGDTTKGTTFAFTPEIGSIADGFYPPMSQIIPDCEGILPANLNCASLLLPFATIQHADPKIITQPSGYLHYSLQRLGFPDTATYTVNIISLDGRLTVSTTPNVYTSLAMLQQVNDSVSYTLSPSTPNNALISYVLQVYNGYYYMRDTVQFYYGKYYSQAAPSTASMGNWINNGWGLCTASYTTPPSSIQSSITGADNYPDDADITVTCTDTIDLTHALNACLQFYTKWAIETDYDYVTVNAVDPSTGAATPLCGHYTRQQPLIFGSGFPVYDGQQPNWVREEMDLSSYLGGLLNIQYELVSDFITNDKGFFFDNVTVTAILDSPTSVHNIKQSAPSLMVYPNPAHEQMNIGVRSFVLGQSYEAILYDCTGRAVLQQPITQQLVSMDVHALPEGVYYLKVSGDGAALPVHKVDILH